MFKIYVALKSISETRQDHRVHLVPRSHHNRKTRKFTKSKRRNNPEYNFKKEKGGVEKFHFSGNHLRLWVSLKLLRVSKYPSTLQFYLEITFVSGLSSRINSAEVLFFSVCHFQKNTKDTMI